MVFCREVRQESESLLATVLIWVIGLAGILMYRSLPRGFTAVAKAAGAISGRNRWCRAEVAPDTWFGFDLGDFYWNRLSYAGFAYDPEMVWTLALVQDVPFTFLDCGANYGYWSVLMGSQVFGKHRAIAVEASPLTHSGLVRNLRDAGIDTAEALNHAVTSRSDDCIAFYERGSHAGASIRPNWLGNERPISHSFEVTTVSVDDLVMRANPPILGPILLKLDIEGAEIEALHGARHTLGGNCLVIYEEYGEDTECPVSAFVMRELDLPVYFVRHDGQLVRINSLDEVRSHKTEKRRGYNFLATRSNSSFGAVIEATLAAGNARIRP